MAEENAGEGEDQGEGNTEGEDQGGEEGESQQEGGEEGQQEGAGGEEQAAGQPWHDGFGNEEVKTYAARYTTSEDMAKAGLELRNQLSKAIVPLPDDASADEIAVHRKKMGIPDEPKGYELAAAEGQEANEQFVDSMGQLFHKADLTLDQSKIINEGYNEFEKEIIAATKKLDDDNAAEGDTKLRSKWGDGYEGNKAAATNFINDERFWGENVDELKGKLLSNGRFLLDDPVILEGFAKIGLMTSEEPARAGMDPGHVQSLEKELDDLMALSRGPDAQEKYWQNEKVQARVAEINEIMVGKDKPIVGEDMRSV